MKSKKLLILALAAASVASVAAAAGCAKGSEGHSHSYSVKSDNAQHWQECACGDKKDAADHADNKNNKSGATGADGVCDVCGVDMSTGAPHVHAYVWMHDNAQHWQECSSCDDRKNAGAHTDVKNNDSGVSVADGRCDLCGAEITEETHTHAYVWKQGGSLHWQECSCGNKINYDLHAEGADGNCTVCGKDLSVPSATAAVVFNTKDRGVAPDPQEVEKGGYAAEPAAPSAAGYAFAGWYEDYECETPFDFAATAVNELTTVYAKWEPVPGATKDHPVVHHTEDVLPNYTFSETGKLYFIYTAEQDGRYSLTLGMGANSKKCRFTTDKDADGAYYGNGCAEDTKYFDLAQGQSVLITLDSAETLAEGAKVGIILTLSDTEPLPADGWLSGEYNDDSFTYALIFDRDKMTVNWNNKTFDAKYLGGKFDYIYWDSTELASNNTQFVFTNKLKYVAENTFELTYYGAGKTQTRMFARYIPQDPIDVSLFSGKYQQVSGEKYSEAISGVKEVGVYPSGNGYMDIGTNRTAYVLGQQGAYYDQKHNTLYIGNYRITLNLADGVPVSINVAVNETTGTWNRVGDCKELPARLPLPDGLELKGAGYGIATSGNTQWWGGLGSGYTVQITDYDEATGVYTFKANKKTYTATVEGEGDATVVKLYNEAGAFLDTLTVKKAEENPTLTADGSEQTLYDEDFDGAWRFYKVPATGYYVFTVSNEDLVIYKDCNPDTKDWSDTISCGEAVYLEEDSFIGFNKDGVSYMKPVTENGATKYVKTWAVPPEGVTFTCSEVEPPKGSADNPYELTGSGSIDGVANGSSAFVEITLPAAGAYKIKLTTGSGPYAGFNYDGTDYGYGTPSGSYISVNVDDNNYATISVTSTTLRIEVYGNWATGGGVTITVEAA